MAGDRGYIPRWVRALGGGGGLLVSHAYRTRIGRRETTRSLIKGAG